MGRHLVQDAFGAEDGRFIAISKQPYLSIGLSKCDDERCLRFGAAIPHEAHNRRVAVLPQPPRRGESFYNDTLREFLGIASEERRKWQGFRNLRL